MKARVLVVDDKPTILTLLVRILGGTHDVITASNGEEALHRLRTEPFDVVLSDVRMPGADGFTVLREAKRMRPDVEVILMTAYASVPSAVEAMKSGAYDYLPKPFDPDEASLLVARALERRRTGEDALLVSSIIETVGPTRPMVGTGEFVSEVSSFIDRATVSEFPILLTGDPGTGKLLVARTIHERSAAGALAVFHCRTAADVPQVLGRVLNGSAHTVVLRNPERLDADAQSTLLRFLADERPTKTQRVRLMALTTLPSPSALREHGLREELCRRLAAMHLHLRPLRERKADIPVLARHILEADARPGTPVPDLSAPALDALVRYDWPENVRELEDVLRSAAAASGGKEISAAALPEHLRMVPLAQPRETLINMQYRAAVDLARETVSREYLRALMQETNGNVTRAAERAGMERESLHRLLKRYDLRSEDFKLGRER